MSLVAKRIVVVTEPIHQRGFEVLERSGDVEVLKSFESRRPLAELAVDANAFLVRVERITRSIIESAGALEVIAKHGVGCDNIDLQAANERGIPVVFTPGANSESVAEHALALMCAMAKRICVADFALKSGVPKNREALVGTELWGKTLGVIGLGRIGSEVARKCHAAFGMRVVGFDPFVTVPQAQDLGVELTGDLERLLKEADFISIHAPLTPATRNLIGEQELRMMRPTSYLVNTSRGGIVDERALYRALTEGWIAGAALDVFVEEPPKRDNPLLQLENVIATPHIGGSTEEAMVRMATAAAEDILRVFAGERPKNVFNPEVYGVAITREG